jgi:hypothetical protein
MASGGILDALGIVPPQRDTDTRRSLADYAGQGFGLLDHYLMGIPSSVAGLVNSAIPYQPLGGLSEAKAAAKDATDAFASNGRLARDLLSLPDAFAGHAGAAPYAPAAARMSGQGSVQAGLLADRAINPIYQAMPSNSVGMFGGKLAKTADHAALAKAQELEASGAPREAIWSHTGWFRGVDGKWRFEIDDSGLTISKRGSGWVVGEHGEHGVLGRLRDVVYLPTLRHQKLVDAYPDARNNLHVDNRNEFYGILGDASHGSYGPDDLALFRPDAKRMIRINPLADADKSRSTTGHEVQHYLQETEGFAFGSSPDMAGSYDAYRRHAGEVEARTVQKRLDYTPEQRRSRPPWEDYDVPEGQQIVRFGR